MSAVLNRVLQSLGASEPETPPPGGMTFEQRAALIGALYELRNRGPRDLDEWIFDLRRVLSYSEATKPLAEALPAWGEKTSSEEIERKASELVRIGIKIAETHPVAAFGGDARYLLTQFVEGALVKSCPVRLLRLVLPTLFVLFFGGLLWGVYQVDGIKNAVSTAVTDIKKGKTEVEAAATEAEASVRSTASTASTQIGILSASLQSSWRAQVQSQAESQLGELTATVKKAEADAELLVHSTLEPAIETAKAQVQPQINAQLAEITQWGNDRKAYVEKTISSENDAVNALKPAIETAKAQVQPQINAQLAEVTQWGNDRKADVEKTISSEKADVEKTISSENEAVNALKPAIETAKAQVQPQINAQLAEITQWGNDRKADVEKTISSEKADVEKTISSENDAVNALKPAIETAKAQVQPQINAQLAEITQWGNDRKADVEKTISSEKADVEKTISSENEAVNALKPAIETAKAQVQPQINAQLAEITQWGTVKKTDAEKAIEARKGDIITEFNNRLLDVQSAETQVKTQMALLLNGVRTEDSDVQKTLLDSRNRLLDTQIQQRDLDAKLANLKALLDQTVRLQAIIDRADSKSTLTFATLVRTLEIKDWVAIGAAIVAVVAIILSGLSFGRRNRSSVQKS